MLQCLNLNVISILKIAKSHTCTYLMDRNFILLFCSINPFLNFFQFTPATTCLTVLNISSTFRVFTQHFVENCYVFHCWSFSTATDIAVHSMHNSSSVCAFAFPSIFLTQQGLLLMQIKVRYWTKISSNTFISQYSCFKGTYLNPVIFIAKVSCYLSDSK